MALVTDHLGDSPSLANARAPNADWPFANIAEASREFAKNNGDRVALLFDKEPDLSFAELDKRADQLSVSLQNLGLKKGDVVSFQLPNWHEAAVINLAAARLGLVINPIVIIYREHEVAYMLANSKSRAIFVAQQYGGFDYLEMINTLAPRLPDLAHVICVRGEACENSSAALKQHQYSELLSNTVGLTPTEPEHSVNDIKMLLYTSGTTGQPKGVLHTHRSLYWAMQTSREHWSIKDTDIMLMASPVTHITGFCNGLEFPYYSGARAAIMERWDAAAALSYIESIRATISLGATPFLQDLLNAAKANNTHLTSLRLFACGGADVPPELIHAANQWFSSVACFRVYGSSEAPLVTQGFIQEEDLAANTDGEIVNYEVQIVDDQGGLAEVNSEGEITVRGPAMMQGYLQPEAQHTAFNERGYFLTGDLGVCTEQNAIIVTGRKKDLIVRGGENISAKQIEDVLHQHDDVSEAAVVAMPHARLGETACAFVVCNAGGSFSFDSMIEVCRQAKLAKQKYPERLELIDALPKTASGKVKKDQLRALVREKVGKDSHAQTASA